MSGPLRKSILAASGLLLVGQLFLVAIAPMTRASGTFAETDGIGILVPDSRGYLEVAGELPERMTLPWMRMGYPVILAVADALGDPVMIVVLAQLVALVAAASVLHYSLERSAGAIAAAFAGMAVLANPMVAQWGRVLITESLFFAGIVALLALGRRALDGPLPRPAALVYGVTAATMPFLRANGIFVLASAVTIIMVSRLRGRSRLAAIVGLWLMVVAILPSFATTVGPPAEGSLASQLRDGIVIEGTEHVQVAIPMPAAARDAGDDLASAVEYAIEHPLATAQLGIRRVVAEALQTRRHYPAVVNIAFATAMAAYLLAALVGVGDERSRGWRAIALIVALPLVAVTAATFASPEGRYGWAFLLPLAPIAGIGADRLVRGTIRPAARLSR